MTPPPVWLMRQAGRYLPEYREIRQRVGGFLDLCFTPELAAEVTLQPVRRFELDAAILFSDILVVPFALGQSVAFREGEGPVLEPVRSSEDLKRLDAKALHERLAPVYETVRLVRRDLPGTAALIGFAGAPWTVATYMIEGRSGTSFSAAKTWAYVDPEGFQALIDLLVDATAAYLARQIEAGAEAVQIFDSWAGVLPEPFARRFVIEPVREIVSILKSRHPGVPVIGFPRGIGVLYPDFCRETGVDAVGLDTTVPADWAARVLQTRCAVQGNLDPQILVTGGALLESEVRRIVRALGRGPFVFNLGHGIVPETPPEHVAALVAAVRAADA
jgi:uroporphyrinogen decarboxylase